MDLGNLKIVAEIVLAILGILGLSWGVRYFRAKSVQKVSIKGDGNSVEQNVHNDSGDGGSR